MPSAVSSHARRLKLTIRGAVQGVGFRPFVYRLAMELGLSGWVSNSSQGVFIEAEGAPPALENLLLRLESEKPPRSFIQSLESSWLDPVAYTGFEIRESPTGGEKTALVLPDIATCPDCLSEIFDPANRRYRYPFTNCTNCGPRFSIIESLPYDRARTSMKGFAMCPACRAEYDDPRDRRFHAQPNACPACGPHLELWRSRACESADGHGVTANPRSHERGYDALLTVAEALRQGQIVAVKGLGGFHLMVDARDDQAIRRLRERKHREEKPFALMFPTLNSVKAVCEVSPLEERLLRSPEAPIVLLKRLVRPQPASARQSEEKLSPLSNKLLAAGVSRGTGEDEALGCCSLSPGERVRVRANLGEHSPEIATCVAPGNPSLGVMLSYTPLHHLLMAELGFPVVATSGNLSDEPICTDEHEALERLGGIADLFLVHNRPIVRHVDDSIVRVMLGRELVLRRARGYAPLPVSLKSEVQSPNSEVVLAVGAHLKNAVALSIGDQVFLSQHIGDLETAQSFSAFQQVIADFQRLYEVNPSVIATDLHPDYLSSRFAAELTGRAGCPQPAVSSTETTHPVMPRRVGVQHHTAHVLSCMAENELEPPLLGVAWDGTGYGLDGTIWGGEFFLVTRKNVEHVAHLRAFRLPGGDIAVREPRRAALGLLSAMSGAAAFERKDLHPLRAFSSVELAAIKTMLGRRVNSPETTSAGRLFDAVASLVGLQHQVRFEGQAAMQLEFALDGVVTDEAYALTAGNRQAAIQLDWAPMIEAILGDLRRGVSVGEISARFHNALVEAIVGEAHRFGERRVVLSGGCFQNRYLTERAVTRLRAEGFQPYWHQRVPPNDGGIALGQVVAALHQKG